MHRNIVLENLGLVNMVINKLRVHARRKGLPVEDLHQEGVISLMRAVGKYNPEKGKLSSFAVLTIRWALLDFIERWRTWEPLPETESGIQGVEDHRHRVEPGTAVEVEELLASLPERERNIVERYYGIGRPAQNIEQIAEGEEVSRQRVWQLLGRALERMRQGRADDLKRNEKGTRKDQ